ncbi:MAG: NAD-dependent deacetylase [Alphaproteobacteria bacterium]|nr:NAD-dependent deacetylase [Alphaproteobacteria bacterium]
MTRADAAFERLCELLQSARRIAVFTGAGVSTESGIPDFRSPGGIWSRYRIVQFQEFLDSADARREYWQRRFASDAVVQGARPNRGHRAIAQLVADGKAHAVITQNVDGLHQKSGIADDRIIQLHGNATYAHCLDCAARYELAPIKQAFLDRGTLPTCRRCNGLVKTATVSFGEAMPADAMRRAEAATLAADLFLVVGSSLVVYPAAGFPLLAKRNGARLVILTRDPTAQDPYADLVLNAEIGPTLGAAVGIQADPPPIALDPTLGPGTQIP